MQIAPISPIPPIQEIRDIENESSPKTGSQEVSPVSVIRGKYLFPVVTISLHALQWGFFLWGLYAINDPVMHISKGENLYNRISPPVETFWFFIVNYWPSCSDARSNSWRLISYQFTHSSFNHIILNTVVGSFFGVILELCHPWCGIYVFAVHQISVVFGALAYAYVSPYRALVGSSAGVYGLIGSTLVHLLLNYDYIPAVAVKCFACQVTGLYGFYGFYFIYAVIVLMIMVEDVISFFLSYKENVAYSAHISGFIIGMFLGCIFYFFRVKKTTAKSSIWRIVLASLGSLGFLGQAAFLIYNYLTSWPPTPLDAYPYRFSCCAQLLHLASNHSISLDEARSQYHCPGNRYGIIQQTKDNGCVDSFISW
jgi:membrane associated rhomboid family serine protease